MAKKKKEFEYESVLDSIFQTLNARQKPNGKLKPIKFNHKPESTDEIARGLAEIAAAPEYYLKNNLYAGTTGPLEAMSLISVDVAEADAYGKPKVELKVKVKDLPLLISDPDALVEKVMGDLKSREHKDGLSLAMRGLDTLVALNQARNAKIKNPLDFALASGTWVSPNLDKKTDQNVVGTAVFKAGGALAGVDANARETIAENAWKAMDNGKMRSQYGPNWWALADTSSAAYKRMAGLEEFKANPAKLAALSAEVRKNFDSSLTAAGVSAVYADDLLKSLSAESNYYDKGQLNNRRFYSYQGNPDKSDIATASDISYSPGYFREAYAERNEAKLKLLQAELVAENSKAVVDNTKVKNILAEINASARNAGVARYNQNLQGYNNLGQYGASNPKNPAGMVSPKLQNQLTDLMREFEDLKSKGINTDAQIASLRKVMDSFGKSTEVATNPIGTNWRNSGNAIRTIGSRIGFGNDAEVVAKAAHQAADLALSAQIFKLEHEKSLISTKYATKAAQDAMAAAFDEQISALRHEQKHYNPKNFQINQWTRTLGRYNQALRIFSSFKDGNFVPDLVSGAIFLDPAFGSSIMADPDAGEAFVLQKFNKIKDKSGKEVFDEEKFMFFLKEHPERAQSYRELTRIYYFLPQNIIKTLVWDGSGFKYALNNRYNRFMDGDGRKHSGFVNMITILTTEKINATTLNPNYNAAFKDELFKMIAAELGIKEDQISGFVLQDYIKKNPGKILTELKSLPPQMAFFGALYDKGILNSGMMRVAKFYSKYSPDAIFNAFKKNVIKEVFQNRIVNATLQRMLTFGGRFGAGTAWGTAVGEFIATKIGFQQLLLQGAQLLAEAIGIGTGPVGIAVMTVINLVGPALLEKLLKPALQVIMYLVSYTIRAIFIGLILLSIAVIFFLGGGTISTFAPTALISPLESAGESIQPETLASYCSPDPSTELPISNIKGKCPFKGTTYCTQLPNKDPTCSHGLLYITQGIMAVDAVNSGYFYAPGECVVVSDAVADSPTCGNKMIVDCTMEGGKVEFTLIHVERAYTSTRISQGHPIAKMEVCGTNGYVCAAGACSSGEHFHIQAAVPNKGQLNTDLLLQKLCGGPGYCSRNTICGGGNLL